MKPLPAVIIGAGGLAREVEWLLRDINKKSPRYEFRGFVIRDRARPGPHDLTDRIYCTEDELGATNEPHAVFIGIGTPSTRLAVAQRLKASPSLAFPPAVHPSVIFDEATCTLGEGAIVCAGTILTVGVNIGSFVYVNLAVTVGHETTIGDGTVINPNVSLSGGVTIGRGCLIGTGAQVLQYLHVRDGAVVGAQAAVTKDVAPGATVVGVPAKERT